MPRSWLLARLFTSPVRASHCRSTCLRLERLDERVNPDGGFSTLPNGMPVLNNRSAAPAAIFIDFDGDTASGSTAYSEDADGTTFTTTEQNNIYEAWRQLSAYYAMYDVNVTTIQPATAVPKAWLVLGNNISGGYSYINVFPNSKAESFNQSSDARTRVSGMAHEVGHNFGLSHQSAYDLFGNRTAEYIGAGSDPLRGPLMGVDFDGLVHKFTLGHTSNSPSTLQDDLAVIAGDLDNHQPAGGDGYRADDYGNTAASSTALTSGPLGFTVGGVIERRTDVDAFSFTWAGGRAFVGATPDYPSGADLRLEVLNAAGDLVASADASVSLDQHLTADLPAGAYTVLVTGHGDYADVGAYNVRVTGGLPAGWRSGDVGAVGKGGSSTLAGSTYTLAGTGSDISSTADSFQYAYRTLTGDGSVVARVTGLDGTSATAKAGVMVRETLAANARHVTTVATPTGGTRAIVRASPGVSSTTNTNGNGVAFTPKFVRVVRTGNSFQTAFSPDGVTWTTIFTTTVTMSSTVYVGLVSNSVVNDEERAGGYNTATFTDVTLTGSLDAAAATTNALPAPTTPTVSLAATGSGLVVQWAAVTGATGYAVERSENGVDFDRVGTTAATTFTDPTLPGSLRYYYRVRATDAAGQSPASASDFEVNRPAAVTQFAVTSWQPDRVILNWKDTSGETGYRVERSTDNVTFTTLTTTAVNVPSTTATGLTPGTLYYFRVTPLSALGDGVAATASGYARLAAVTGLAVTPGPGVQLNLAWTALAGATQYRVERSTDGGVTFTTLTTVSTNSHSDATVTALGEYHYRVTGVSTGAQGVTGAVVFAAAPAATALPAPWVAQDIGTVGGPGATGESGGTFTTVASGSDIWFAADSFRFTHQPLNGDGVVTARVATTEATSNGAKHGVMVRESLAANSRHVMVVVTPGGSVMMQTRSSTGGSTTTVATQTGAAPRWVRLVRKGAAFTGYASADGVTWSLVGTVNLSMTQAAFTGLAATAQNNAVLNTSTFTNVSVVRPATVESVVVNDGTAQRSRVTSLTVTFSGLVTLPADALTALVLTRQDGTALSGVSADLSLSTPTQTVVRLTFAGTDFDSGSLRDGRYTLRVRGDLITDAAGFFADADGDGLSGGDRASALHRLFGDSDGDADTDTSDLGRFRQALSGAVPNPAAFDSDGDGDVDSIDLARFRQRFGVVLP